jgi:hypothetical protein
MHPKITQQIELITIRVHAHSRSRIRTVGPWVRIPLTFSRCWYRQCLCDRLIPRQWMPNGSPVSEVTFPFEQVRQHNPSKLQDTSPISIYIKAELVDLKDGQQTSRALVHAVSRRSLNAEAQIRSQSSRCGICEGQTGTCSRFHPSTLVTSYQYHFRKAPYTFTGLQPTPALATITTLLYNAVDNSHYR